MIKSFAGSLVLVVQVAAYSSNSLVGRVPLQTQGSRVVDTFGQTVRLACVNWYGAHMERFVVNGLDLQPLEVLSKQIADQEFNCVRLPFSLEMFFNDPVVADDSVAANPQLYGNTAMQIFDKTVEALTKAGVAVILNNHISDAKWCCSETDGNGLWYNKNYSTEQWIEAVVQISARYKENKLVIGNDLRNEIRNDVRNLQYQSWGDGTQNDWKLAATNCGNKILEQTPDQLVIVEGLNYANDMSVIKNSPIQLDQPNRLVYSFHYYSWQGVTTTDNYTDFVAGLTSNVGYILEENQPWTAPLWLGEFGQNVSDNYWQFLTRYLSENPSIGWAQWSWNGYKTTPDEEESFGVMNADMETVRDEWKLKDL